MGISQNKCTILQNYGALKSFFCSILIIENYTCWYILHWSYKCINKPIGYQNYDFVGKYSRLLRQVFYNDIL